MVTLVPAGAAPPLTGAIAKAAAGNMHDTSAKHFIATRSLRPLQTPESNKSRVLNKDRGTARDETARSHGSHGRPCFGPRGFAHLSFRSGLPLYRKYCGENYEHP